MFRCGLPDIRVSGEDTVFERLGGHPAHGQQPLPSFAVIVRLVDVSGHAEICQGRTGLQPTEVLPVFGVAPTYRWLLACPLLRPEQEGPEEDPKEAELG